MDAAAKIGRNPVSKHQIQPVYIVCVFYFFWLSASHDLRLGMDGMLLALCDHGFERSG